MEVAAMVKSAPEKGEQRLRVRAGLKEKILNDYHHKRKYKYLFNDHKMDSQFDKKTMFS